MDITQLVLLSVRWHTFNKKMQENINELIDINLKLLSESQGGKLFHIDFVDENSKRLKDSQRFSEILVKKGLVDLEPTKRMRCDITEYGFNIAKNGGWLNYLERKAEQEKQVKKEDKEKENLEFELAKSQGWSDVGAAFAGREVATDFAMRGNSKFLNFWSRNTLFFNAGLQANFDFFLFFF